MYIPGVKIDREASITLMEGEELRLDSAGGMRDRAEHRHPIRLPASFAHKDIPSSILHECKVERTYHIAKHRMTALSDTGLVDQRLI